MDDKKSELFQKELKKKLSYRLALREEKKLKKYLCSNADIKLNNLDDIKNLKVSNNGCSNKRRTGSKYCQECSDSYKN